MSRFRPWSPDMGKSKEEYQEEIKRFNDRLYGGNRGDRGNRLSDNPDYDRSKGRYGGLKSPGPKRPDWSRPGMSRLEKRDEKREWGKSRPGEMYIQIEGPGNPSWEARNPGRKPVERSTRWQDIPLPNPSQNRPRSTPQKDYSPMMTDKERARAGGREAKDRWEAKWGTGGRDLITRPTRDLNRGMGQRPLELPRRRGIGFYDTYSGDKGPFADAGPTMGDIDRGRRPDDLGPVMDRIGPDKPVGPDTDRWGRPKGTVYFDRRHEDPDAWERRRRELEPPSPTEPRRPAVIQPVPGPRDWEPRRPEPRRIYRPPTQPTPTEFSQRLSSDEERMRLLTGEADPKEKPWSSQFDGRSDWKRPPEEYDPQDQKFNNQFSESPRGRQPWESTLTENPLERDPLEGYNVQEGRYNRTPPRPPERFTGRRRGRRNIKNRR